MYLFDLQSKLKKLNSNLYIKGGGLYLREHKRATNTLKDHELHYDLAAGKYLKDLYTGQVDTYIEALAKEYMPEYDEFDTEKGILRVKGWRSLLCSLVKKKIIKLESAQRIFSSSLLEQTYDKLGFDGKLAWARREK